MSFTLGGLTAELPQIKRLSMLLWGPAGVGKTTLAATMPGRKVWINFDPDGTTSIAGLDNIVVFDFSGNPEKVMNAIKNDDALGLEKVIEQFDTLIVDSVSTLTEHTLNAGIKLTKGATVERPSPGAYQARNNLAMIFINNLLKITAKHNKHLCIIAHEGPPTKNDDNIVIEYTLSLGGSLPQQLAQRFNEVWFMYENERSLAKMLLVRSARLRKPVKSRMFDTSSAAEFVWKFDIKDFDAATNMRIDRWYDEWCKLNNHGPETATGQLGKLKLPV